MRAELEKLLIKEGIHMQTQVLTMIQQGWFNNDQARREDQKQFIMRRREH